MNTYIDTDKVKALTTSLWPEMKCLIMITLGVFLFLCCNNGNKYTGNDDVDELSFYDSVEVHEADDGTMWYKVWLSDHVGVLNESKEVVIKANATNICDLGNCFIVYSNQDVGDDKKVFFTEVIDLKGNIIIPKERAYYGISKVKIGDSNRYYFEVSLRGDHKVGVCDKDGNEIIPPVYKYIEYKINEIEDEPIKEYFICTYNKSEIPIFAYIDKNGNYKEYDVTSIEYIKERTSHSDIFGWILDTYDSPVQTIAFFDGFCYLGERHFVADSIVDNNEGVTYYKSLWRNGYCDLEVNMKAGTIINRTKYDPNEYKYYRLITDTELERFNEDMDHSFEYLSDIRYVLDEKDYETYYDYTEIDNTETQSPNYNQQPIYNTQPVGISDYSMGASDNGGQVKVPRRDMCMACKRSGYCGACNGTGQMVSNMSIAKGDIVYERCRNCRGAGVCPACKGDGYLDEGIDF